MMYTSKYSSTSCATIQVTSLKSPHHHLKRYQFPELVYSLGRVNKAETDFINLK